MVEGKNWSETSNKAFSPLGAFFPHQQFFFRQERPSTDSRSGEKEELEDFFNKPVSGFETSTALWQNWQPLNF